MVYPYKYRSLYRPPHFAALPKGLVWDYVEAPAIDPMIAVRRGLPLSRHRFGVIATERMLTPEELESFDLVPHE